MGEFKITRGTGFHLTFSNGVSVSVQFGKGSYSENGNILPNDENILGEINNMKRGVFPESKTAEDRDWETQSL